jgi:hypothetical protein
MNIKNTKTPTYREENMREILLVNHVVSKSLHHLIVRTKGMDAFTCYVNKVFRRTEDDDKFITYIASVSTSEDNMEFIFFHKDGTQSKHGFWLSNVNLWLREFVNDHTMVSYKQNA